MNPVRVFGDVECDVGEVVVQESPEARRRRLNRERMRRNRSNPMYREREQRRQRERRRERLMASKIAKNVQQTPPQNTLIRGIPQRAAQESVPWLRELHGAPTSTAQCVVALPMGGYPSYPNYSGLSVLPPAVALSMLSSVPPNVMLVVADDGVQPQCTAIPVAHALESTIDLKTPVHLSKNLNLDKSGGFWYSNETPSYATACVNRDVPVIKREC